MNFVSMFNLSEKEMRNISHAIGLILILAAFNASAQSVEEKQKIEEKIELVRNSVAQVPPQSTEKFKGIYSGNNNVTLCSIEESPRCQTLKMPKKVGHVTEVVFGQFHEKFEASWLAFTAEKASFCIAEGSDLKVRCKIVGLTNYNGVEITFDKKRSGIPSLVFSSKAQKSYVQNVADSFLVRLHAAAESLDTEGSKLAKCKSSECEITVQKEDDPVEIPVVVIEAPFPAEPFTSGAVVNLPVILGDPPTVPDPLPSGVAPGDILNARDPVGMAACTAAYYRVYVIMAGGCVDVRSPVKTRICFEKAINAYYNNLETECYAKYY